MTQANDIPHFYLSDELDVTNLSDLREKLKKNHKIALMSFLIKSFSLSLN